MKQWVKSWEEWATLRPDGSALVNARGQDYSFSDLQRRAWSLEHRFRVFGLAAGDRLEVSLERHQQLDDWIIAAWAAGLLRSACVPSWGGFTRRERGEWKLNEKFPIRLSVDLNLGTETVSAMPGHASHDLALGWPERSLEGGDRTSAPMVIRPISDDLLLRAIQKWKQSTGIGPADCVAIMEGGLSGLSWLSVFAALTVGARVVQVPLSSPMNTDELSAFLSRHKVSWICASPEWLSKVGRPPSHPLEGVIAPWGHACPAVRDDWSSRLRWLEAWCPASCGWWWGCTEYTPGVDLCLEGCDTDWVFKLDKSGRYLWVEQEDQWSPIACVSRSPSGSLRLGLSGAIDSQLNHVLDVLVEALKSVPRFGAVCSGEVSGRHFVAVLPRCRDESPQDVLREAKMRADRIIPGASSAYQWVVADSIIPRDECGGFHPRHLYELRQS